MNFKLPKFVTDKKYLVVSLILLSIVVGELFWARSYLRKPAAEASLTLSPPSGTYKLGGTFTVRILLDTKEDASDGVDVRLSFDPEILQVGSEVKNGALFPQVAANKIDNENGSIHFSVLNPPGKDAVKGGGILGEITFLALAPGQAKVSFDFVLGSTTDSNVALAGEGVDILKKVTNGEYSVE